MKQILNYQKAHQPLMQETQIILLLQISMEFQDQQILQMQFHTAVLKIRQMDGHNLVHQ